MDDLVKRLSEGRHPVKFESRTDEIKEVKKRLEDGFVFIKFTETKGGTELGINIDKEKTNLENADFEKGIGKIHVIGTCELNYHKIRCFADIDLASRKGSGYLEVIS